MPSESADCYSPILGREDEIDKRHDKVRGFRQRTRYEDRQEGKKTLRRQAPIR